MNPFLIPRTKLRYHLRKLKIQKRKAAEGLRVARSDARKLAKTLRKAKHQEAIALAARLRVKHETAAWHIRILRERLNEKAGEPTKSDAGP